MLAHLIEVISGQPLQHFLSERLFGPLGMTSSSYRHSEFVSRPNHTAMHARINGSWQQAYQRNADQQAPAGGASSSACNQTSALLFS